MATSKTIANVIAVLVLHINSILGQEVKADFLANDKINTSGNALTYYVQNLQGNFLILKDLKNNKTFKLKDIHRESILTNDFFIGLNYNTNTLYKVNLIKSTKDSIADVNAFKYFDNNEILLLYQKKDRQLQSINLKDKKTKIFNEIEQYTCDVENGILHFINSLNEINGYDFKQDESYKFKNIPIAYKIKYTVSNTFDGSFYSFFTIKDTLKIYKTSALSNVLVFSQSIKNVDNNTRIDTLFQEVRVINSSQIALGIKTLEPPINQDKPEIWLGNNAELPFVLEKKKQSIKLGIIDIKEHRFFDKHNQFSTDDFRINSKTQDIYTLNTSQKKDREKMHPEIEVFVHDKISGKNKYIGNFNGTNQHILSSKYSNLLFYFKNNNWFFYDDLTEKHTNFTEGLDDVFYDTNTEIHKIVDSPINQYLLFYKDNYFVFNGQKKVWLFDIKKKQMSKLVPNENKKHAISASNFKLEKKKFDWSTTAILNDFNNIILNYTSEKKDKQEIVILDKKGKITNLLETDFYVDNLVRSTNKITYIKQKSNSPPALYLLDFKTKTETLIYQSNAFDTLAKYIKNENYEWINNNGEYRNFVITYPKNYDPNKKYPAIFDIYEKKNQVKNRYVSASIIEGNGIIARQYADDGYFIIHPSIFYEIGNTGVSATNSVLEVLDKALTFLPIDVDRVGLIGHSFGGYETNFILTQTSRFKTAISSSGVADIIDAYFTISKEYNITDMWRYETQQFRMGQSFFEIPEKYIANSPLFQAKNIQTPLLLLTGNEDYVVNWRQSITMFLALKRLNKEVNLIIYPKEGHVLMSHKNKVDASEKIKSWFDYYLKNKEKPKWLESNN